MICICDSRLNTSAISLKIIVQSPTFIKEIYGFCDVGEFEETTDKNEIQEWEKYKEQTHKLIENNIEFFTNLPEGYDNFIN